MPYIAIKLATPQALSATQTQQLVQGVTDIMVNTLRKKRHLVAVSVEDLPMDQWFISEKSLSVQTAFIQAYITESTNTELEKSQAIFELYTLLASLLGAVEEATYIVLTNVPAKDWGYAGKTQASRYQVPSPITSEQTRHYVQRAHQLQNAEIKYYFLKLVSLIGLSVRYCIVTLIMGLKVTWLKYQAYLGKQLTVYG